MRIIPQNPWLRAGFIAGLLMFACAALLGYDRWRTFSQSRAAYERIVAGLDKEDPDWRWDSIHAGYKTLSPEQNSYFVIRKILDIQPGRICQDDDKEWQWYATGELYSSSEMPELRDEWVEPDPMPLWMADWIGHLVGKRREELKLARSLVGLPEGSHPVEYQPNYVSTRTPTLDAANHLQILLQFDACASAQLGDAATALTDIHAMVNAARSYGEINLSCYALQHRDAGSIRAVLSLGRILSLLEAPADGLAEIQTIFSDEASRNLLKPALRLERAGMDKAIAFIQSKFDTEGIPQDEDELQKLGLPKDGRWTNILRYRPYMLADRAAYLESVGEVLHFAEQPVEVMGRKLKEARDHADSRYHAGKQFDKQFLLRREPFAASYCELPWRACGVHLVKIAYLRCAVAAIACERYRMARAKWPEKLEDLVPAYLTAVPADPFTGDSLIYRRDDSGVKIYSVGSDYNDDGGDVAINEKFRNLVLIEPEPSDLEEDDPQNPGEKRFRKLVGPMPPTYYFTVQSRRNKDAGIRLWNVDLRRKDAPFTDSSIPAFGLPGH